MVVSLPDSSTHQVEEEVLRLVAKGAFEFFGNSVRGSMSPAKRLIWDMVPGIPWWNG